MNPIEHAEHRGGLIELIYEGDQEDNFKVDIIRGGLMWPASEYPGYLCILGQRPKFNEAPKARRKPLVLLAEHQVDLPKEMIAAITKEIRRLLCRSFFVDYDEETLIFQEELELYLKRFRYGKIDIDAPYLRDWTPGVLSMRQWQADKALEAPEDSILNKQVKRLTREDQDESRRGPFYAVDALRCVLGSFEMPVKQPVRIMKSGWVGT